MSVDRRHRPRRRSVVPTVCPHCLRDQGSTTALSAHVRFACPVLRPLLCWSILAGPTIVKDGTWAEWRGVNGSKIVNLTIKVGLSPTDRDFDQAMEYAVEQMRTRVGR